MHQMESSKGYIAHWIRKPYLYIKQKALAKQFLFFEYNLPSVWWPLVDRKLKTFRQFEREITPWLALLVSYIFISET